MSYTTPLTRYVQSDTSLVERARSHDAQDEDPPAVTCSCMPRKSSAGRARPPSLDHPHEYLQLSPSAMMSSPTVSACAECCENVAGPRESPYVPWRSECKNEKTSFHGLISQSDYRDHRSEWVCVWASAGRAVPNIRQLSSGICRTCRGQKSFSWSLVGGIRETPKSIQKSQRLCQRPPEVRGTRQLTVVIGRLPPILVKLPDVLPKLQALNRTKVF